MQEAFNEARGALDKVPFIYYVSTFIAQNLIWVPNFPQKLGLFVKTNEFIFQHYILTKFLYSFG